MSEERNCQELLSSCLTWLAAMQAGHMPNNEELAKDVEDLSAYVDSIVKLKVFAVNVPAAILTNAAWDRLYQLVTDGSLGKSDRHVEIPEIDEGQFMLDIMKAVAVKAEHLIIHIQHEEKDNDSGPE